MTEFDRVDRIMTKLSIKTATIKTIVKVAKDWLDRPNCSKELQEILEEIIKLGFKS